MDQLRENLRAILDQRLNGPYLRFVCSVIIGVFLLLQVISFATTDRGPTVFGPYLGADFAAFYSEGSIFNSTAAEQLYDPNVQYRFYRDLFPRVPPQSPLPYSNAPFFVLPFALLAHLPYQGACLLWMSASCLLYCGALILLLQTGAVLPKANRSTVLLLAFSFFPFLFEVVGGGQASAIAFFVLALTITLERRGYRLAAGVALALLSYKPPLLVLILPMLVVTRRWALLCGFALGILGLASVSVQAVGWQGCRNYVHLLLAFLDSSTGTVMVLRTWKYVDINSFSRLLLPGSPWGRLTIVILCGGVVLPLLARLWWTERQRGDAGRLSWAVTIVWTLVLNVYVPVYDTILVVISILLTGNLLDGKKEETSDARYRYLLVLLYLTPMFTQTIARWSGFQPYTLVLAAFGIYLSSSRATETERPAFVTTLSAPFLSKAREGKPDAVNGRESC